MGKWAPKSGRAAAILAPMLLVFFTASCTLPGADCAVQSSTAAQGQDPLKALSCSAIGGNKVAQISLARAYETGTGVPRDMKAAVDWYKRAATSSNRYTPDYVAPVDDQRFGRTQTFETGTEIPGSALAQFRLGEIYLAGDGVKQSDKRAIRWLKRAARQGYTPAIELLAKMDAGK